MDSYQATTDAYNKLASAYEDKFMHLDLYNDTYDSFCALIKKQEAKVFEIGCGPGNITKYLLEKRPDLKIEAIDVAENMIQIAKKNNPTAYFKIMDCRNIDKITKKFDAIIGGFCLPYLSKTDCVKLLKDCSQLVDKGGIIYLSTIEGKYEESGFETSSNGEYKMYIYYYPEDYLQQSLKENGFELIELKRKAYLRANGSQQTHLIFICQKAE